MATTGITAFVTMLYQNALGRLPDAAGLAVQVNAILSGALTPNQIAYNILNSAEIQANARAITQSYFTILNRLPEPAGFDFRQQLLASGQQTIPQLNQIFGESAEFKAISAHYATNTDFVSTYLYGKVLQGATDAARVSALIAKLDNGTETRWQAIQEIQSLPYTTSKFTPMVDAFLAFDAFGAGQNYFLKFGNFTGDFINNWYDRTTFSTQPGSIQKWWDGPLATIKDMATLLNGMNLPGNSKYSVDATAPFLIGNNSGERLEGNANGGNAIFGGTGNDTIIAHRGDTIFTGLGADTVQLNHDASFYVLGSGDRSSIAKLVDFDGFRDQNDIKAGNITTDKIVLPFNVNTNGGYGLLTVVIDAKDPFTLFWSGVTADMTFDQVMQKISTTHAGSMVFTFGSGLTTKDGTPVGHPYAQDVTFVNFNNAGTNGHFLYFTDGTHTGYDGTKDVFVELVGTSAISLAAGINGEQMNSQVSTWLV